MAGIPIKDSVLYIFLTGVCFTFALSSGLLHVNKITVTDGIQIYTYRLQKIVERGVIFQPVEINTLPIVKLGNPEYWQQYKMGSTHKIHLRKGKLMFYQVNAKHLYEKLDKFYKAYQKNK